MFYINMYNYMNQYAIVMQNAIVIYVIIKKI